MPRLAVLIPAHGAGKTIGIALRSTFDALPRDSEVHLHFDGEESSDYAGLGALLDDPKLKVSESSEKLGVAQSLNKLIATSDSEFIARMDADDINLRVRFRRQEDYLHARNLDFCFGPAIIFGPKARPLPMFPQVPLELKPDETLHALSLYNPFVHPTLFGKREVIQSLDGYSDVKEEDYDLWIRAAESGYKLGRMPGYLLLLRKHKSQVTAGGTWKHETLGGNNARQRLLSKASGGTDLEQLAVAWDRKSLLHRADRRGLAFLRD